jgi:hypothetical protein
VPWYSGSIWFGFGIKAWLRLLIRNNFAISPRKLPLATAVTLFAVGNSFLGGVQRMLFGRRIDQVVLPDDPIFVIGHWRSGTTMLHELLAADPRHTAPTTYQSFVPLHAVLSERTAVRRLGFLLPASRPMDNMALGWNRPQDEELALCCMGAPSPLPTIAFPNRAMQDPEYLTLKNLSPAELDAWKRIWFGFLRMVLYRRPGQLVLKSNQYAFRLEALDQMFPNARYVHIFRDPFAVFPSTDHFWRTMYRTYGLQVPRFENLKDFIFDTYLKMSESIASARTAIGERWHDLRYEDLVGDPLGELRDLYAHLDLGDFGEAGPAITAWLAEQSDYRTNSYDLPEALRAEIQRRWSREIDFHRTFRGRKAKAAPGLAAGDGTSGP